MWQSRSIPLRPLNQDPSVASGFQRQLHDGPDSPASVPLLEVVKRGDVGEAKKLLEDAEARGTADAILNVRDLRRHTALHAAAGAGHLEMVKVLVEHGAPLDALVSQRRAFLGAYMAPDMRNGARRMGEGRRRCIARLGRGMGRWCVFCWTGQLPSLRSQCPPLTSRRVLSAERTACLTAAGKARCTKQRTEGTPASSPRSSTRAPSGRRRSWKRSRGGRARTEEMRCMLL